MVAAVAMGETVVEDMVAVDKAMEAAVVAEDMAEEDMVVVVAAAVVMTTITTAMETLAVSLFYIYNL